MILIFISVFMYVFHAQVSIPIICTFWGYSCQYYYTYNYTLCKQEQSADNSYHQDDWIDDYQVHCIHVLSYVQNISIIIWFRSLNTLSFGEHCMSTLVKKMYLRILNEYISILNAILMSTHVQCYFIVIVHWY